MEVEEINQYIKKNCDHELLYELKEETLFNSYIKCKSVQKKRKIYETILENNLDIKDFDKEKINKIICNIIQDLFNNNLIIPAGTKGVIKGNHFNLYIKKILEEKFNNKSDYILNFEKNHPIYKTHEIPDWFLENKKTGKTIIGYNQLSLWGGGHQMNRGSKYINLQNTEKCKFICVIAYSTIVKTKKSKLYKLFNNGINKKILCYPTDLLDKINYHMN